MLPEMDYSASAQWHSVENVMLSLTENIKIPETIKNLDF